MSDCKEVFTDIYARKVWGDGSGGGSGEQAEPYVDFIASELDKMPDGGRNVLDIGCGDMRIARAIIPMTDSYIGVDAAENAASKDWHIMHADVLVDDLPMKDLILCKEVLQHLSNAQVQLLLDRTAHYPRRLFTNTTQVEGVGVNEDIETGQTRPVDLTLPPFNQPARTVFTYGCWIVQELTAP